MPNSQIKSWRFPDAQPGYKRPAYSGRVGDAYLYREGGHVCVDRWVGDTPHLSGWGAGVEVHDLADSSGGKVRGTETCAVEVTAFKADTGKPRWTLLLDCARGCGRAVRAVVRVLNFAVRPVADGGKGYVPHSWREVPNARERYEDALHRHLDCIRDGETHDAESGESHWAHVATNALFLWELDNPKEK